MSNIWEYEWDEEPMKKLEIGYEEYEHHLYEYLYESGDDAELTMWTLSDMAFCGCQDCTTREAIAYFLPKIIDMFNAGEIRTVTEQDKVRNIRDKVRTITQQDKENNDAGVWQLPFGRDDEHGTSETT